MGSVTNVHAVLPGKYVSCCRLNQYKQYMTGTRTVDRKMPTDTEDNKEREEFRYRM